MKKAFIAIIFFGTIIASTFITSSCKCERQATPDPFIDSMEFDTAEVSKVSEVVVALPTPIEVSMLIKKMGINYQSSLLHNPERVHDYQSSSKMAMNFGIYVTDLCYAELFGQTQTVLTYRKAIDVLTEGLGIKSSVDQELLAKIDPNIDDRDKILQIISDTYASCAASLNESDRQMTVLYMILGGWIEGMYIASSLTNENLHQMEKRVMNLVVEQKLTFDLIWKTLSDFPESQESKDIKHKLSALAPIFDRLSINQSEGSVDTDSLGEAELSAQIDIESSAQVFDEIRTIVQNLRHSFIAR